MKLLLSLLLLVMIGIPQIASAQPTENFGKPIEAYAIRPGLLLSITRYPDGKPKTMIVESALAAQDMQSVAFPGILNQKTIDELIDQLVPIESRGARIETAKGALCADYCYFLLEHYENVQIDLISGMVWEELDKPFGQTYKDQMQRLVIKWPIAESPPSPQ